jgi:hypothetical protein
MFAVLALTLLVWSALDGADFRPMNKPLIVDDTFLGKPAVSGKTPGTRSMTMLPPGTVLDSSYYDWQRNGSLNRRIWVNSDGSIHATYMVSPDAGWAERGMIYYYADQFGGNFLSSGHITTFRNGYGNISSYPVETPDVGAIAVVSTHNFGTIEAFAYVDAFQGLGAFTELTTNTADSVVWPKPSVNSDGSITLVGTLMNDMFVNGILHNVAYDRAEDAVSGFTGNWTWFGQNSLNWQDGDMQWPTVASGANGKVGVVITDFAADLHFYESTDNGITFAETLLTNAAVDTVGLPTQPDTLATVFLPWINSDIVYTGEEPHVVWTGMQGANDPVQGRVLFDFRTRILHWSPSTGTDTVVVAPYQSAFLPPDTTYVNAGGNHAAIDWPQIGISPDGSVLFVIYLAFTPHDVDPVNQIGFGDVWGVFSLDNGETWSEPTNITNPDGMYPGTDDRFASISPVNYDAPIAPGMDAHIVFQTDDLAGSFVQAEETENLDYFMYLGVDFDVPSGIEDGENESSSLPRAFALHQNYPNPFNPSTTIRFEVPEGENQIDLSVYDSRGRLVKILFSGNMETGEHQLTWDGRNSDNQVTASGIYFLRLKSNSISRTIKMVMVK